MVENSDRGEVQSVARTFALLEALRTMGGEAGVSELAAAVTLPAPTIHRLLQTLSGHGYVVQLPSRRYSLGPGLIRLGDGATRRLSLWAMPVLAGLGQGSQETANLAILDGDMVTYVAQVPSPHQMRMFTEVGRRVLPHAAGGKAILSQLPDARVLDIVSRTGMPSFTPTTLTTEAALLADLKAIRQRGYAIDEGEQEVGVRCYALPVAGLALPAAVSVSGPESRVTLASAERMVQLLREAAALLRAAVPA